METELNLNEKLNKYFPGKVVKKDLTQDIKEGANVPTYVLEYLLGMYAASSDEESIRSGVNLVKNILAENYVRPDEAEQVKSKIREEGRYSVIDKITVKLNTYDDVYEASFSNLGLKRVQIDSHYVTEYDKLLAGGIWCMVSLDYFYDEDQRGASPFIINDIQPIQTPNLDISEILEGRKYFSKEEWINVLIRSMGMEASQFEEREKWHLLLRLVPFVENNYNLVELGPRSTGKSYAYKELSPNSILVSGGQTTVANLFYNMNTRKIGLVGLWDVVAFDEVAGIKFKDKDGIQIMKDFMNSGSFSRGKEYKEAPASMVFLGNINESVEYLSKTSHLFSPFSDDIKNDSAFFDRIHYYLPGWEVPKLSPKHFTSNFGFITDYLSAFMREMRKQSFSDAYQEYFTLGNSLNQRDTTAVKKTVSGLVKLIYPNGEYTKENIEEILQYALEGRRRVKEQLKKMAGMEFYDVMFSYIDRETLEENYVTVPEEGGDKLIPKGTPKAGHVYFVGHSVDNAMIGVYKLENNVVDGNGKFEKTGYDSNSQVKESLDVAYKYFAANIDSISANYDVKNKDFLMHIQDLQGVGLSDKASVAELIGLSSAAFNKPVLDSLAVIGDMTLSGTVQRVNEVAEMLQICLDVGAKHVLLPSQAITSLNTVPADILVKLQMIFYEDPIDAIYKALGVN